jgi:alkanesulfonate monooxygenase SsuD/methylene tetrahydromethanopterin reductase-like flavin-dependent oxidoreductase (luciferase family)
MTMRLGMLLRYHGDSLALDEVLEAERLGYDSVWSGEAYGTDAVTPTAWILARTTRIRAGTGIMQMQARTPACTAMTALTLQALSNNRFLLGIGASGPQVVEGWHGVPFGKPMARTREYIEILRKILKREAALQHQGELYQIPYTGPGATGLGKPLKIPTCRSMPPRSRRSGCARRAKLLTACCRSSCRRRRRRW